MFVLAMLSGMVGICFIALLFTTYGIKVMLAVPGSFFIALSASILTWILTPKAEDLSSDKLKMKIVTVVEDGDVVIRRDTTYSYFNN